ncbi:uncharacterized protein LOC111061861 [Nilaparvata lugens]|uniref:uncharacterized protein LOC111061861 n=1 Tax=Nilaparvata lugens TaxID=108931 RepID=UPI00193D07BA|nr:uncharacterized protein LOC111061861 [Nilaparvata lugens]
MKLHIVMIMLMLIASIVGYSEDIQRNTSIRIKFLNRFCPRDNIKLYTDEAQTVVEDLQFFYGPYVATLPYGLSQASKQKRIYTLDYFKFMKRNYDHIYNCQATIDYTSFVIRFKIKFCKIFGESSHQHGFGSTLYGSREYRM